MFFRKCQTAIVAIRNTLLKRWTKIRLLQRLIIVCLVFLIIPVLVIGYLLFSIVFPLAQTENREAIEEVVYQLNENLQFRIKGYQNILVQLTFDPRLSQSLMQDYLYLPDAVDNLQQINFLLGRINTYFPMRKICIYKSNTSLPEDGGSILNMERAANQPWYKDMLNSKQKKFFWYYDYNNSEQPFLNVTTWLNDSSSNEKFGIIKLEIPCRTVFENMSNPLQSKHGWVMLLDGQGMVLNNYLDKKTGDNVGNLPYLTEVYKNKSGWFMTEIDGKQSMIVYETNELGWKVIAVVSREELWQKLQLIKNVALIISALFVVLTFIVLMSFGLRISIRLNSLVKSMRNVRQGAMGLTVTVYGNDEFAELEDEFNTMSKRLERSINEISEAKAWAETEKLRLLQAQINPHFLYNTLSLVKSMAMDIGSSEICSIIDALSKFFRISLNNGSDVLLVSEELMHLRAYLEIHEQRYPNRVTIIYEIDDEVLDCEIIKVTLQPIIENALVHAFVETGGQGQILISVEHKGDNLYFKVTDNGKGLTREQITVLLSQSTEIKNHAGFGIYNVNERLKRYYGKAYGLSIDSTIGIGTSVEIRIPMRFKQ